MFGNHWFDYDRREEIFLAVCVALYRQVYPTAQVTSLQIILPAEEETGYTVYPRLHDPFKGDLEDYLTIDPSEDRLWWDGAEFDIEATADGSISLAPLGVPA